MNTCSGVRSSHPARLLSFGPLDGRRARLRRPHVRVTSAGFRLERLATAFMNNPSYRFPLHFQFLISGISVP